MKSGAVVLAVAAVLTVASASGYGGGAPGGGGGAGGGALSIPAPPCPKNYLFSCQPNLAPAPCAPPAASYGSAGSYSENYPTIVNAPFPGYQGGPVGYQHFNHVPQYQQFYGHGGPSN